MKNVIHHVRSKPSHVRDRIIWICAGVAVAILLIVWAIVGNGRKIDTNESFFQDFNQGVNEGKNILPPNPLK